MAITNIRTYKGQKYEPIGTYGRKTDANSEAEKWREKGRSVRVLYNRSLKHYVVWVSMRKSRKKTK